MYRKFLSFILLIFFFQLAVAQDEFITIWKSNVPAITPPIDLIAPNLAGNNQIWFPGIGENYTIQFLKFIKN